MNQRNYEMKWNEMLTHFFSKKKKKINKIDAIFTRKELKFFSLRTLKRQN